jgi:hypothetical protein
MTGGQCPVLNLLPSLVTPLGRRSKFNIRSHRPPPLHFWVCEPLRGQLERKLLRVTRCGPRYMKEQDGAPRQSLSDQRATVS